MTRSTYIVNDETGCWEWTGAKNDGGYGIADVGGVALLAHRVFYSMYAGPILPGHHVHHECRNRACVNPEHLEALSGDDHSRIHGKQAIPALGKASLTTLAAATGFSAAAFSLWVNGRRRITFKNAQIVAETTGIPIAEVCSFFYEKSRGRSPKGWPLGEAVSFAKAMERDVIDFVIETGTA